MSNLGAKETGDSEIANRGIHDSRDDDQDPILHTVEGGPLTRASLGVVATNIVTLLPTNLHTDLPLEDAHLYLRTSVHRGKNYVCPQ